MTDQPSFEEYVERLHRRVSHKYLVLNDSSIEMPETIHSEIVAINELAHRRRRSRNHWILLHSKLEWVNKRLDVLWKGI